MNSPPQPCQLCGRTLKLGTTDHHLIPRACHKNRWFRKNFTREQMRLTIVTCKDCHKAIHKLIPREKELGRDFNTLDALLVHPPIAKFVQWIRRQK